MKQLLRVSRLALLVCMAVAVSALTVSAAKAAPPNWKVSATGTATLVDLDLEHFTRTDADAFGGHSSHLGNFTATGYHVLDLLTGQFAGVATYTAANGDSINVAYTGQLFPSGDAAVPYGVVADIEIQGGSGRFADATGGGVLTGGFTGAIPVGEFFFDIDGTLSTK